MSLPWQDKVLTVMEEFVCRVGEKLLECDSKCPDSSSACPQAAVLPPAPLGSVFWLPAGTCRATGPRRCDCGFGNMSSLSQCHQLFQLIQHLRAGQAPNNQNCGLRIIVRI